MLENVLVGLVMIVGLAGVVVPGLPGTLLILGAGFVWAYLADAGAGPWVVLGVMTAFFVIGIAAKYVLPGRRLAGGLPRSTIVSGAVGALVGLIVLPPVGLLIGGVAGVYLAEAKRVGPGPEARRATIEVLKAIGVGILAELIAGMLMIATWMAGLVLT